PSGRGGCQMAGGNIIPVTSDRLITYQDYFAHKCYSPLPLLLQLNETHRSAMLFQQIRCHLRNFFFIKHKSALCIT
ncbi:hypothetical protein ACVTXU_004321, partial [Escherichia coli]